MQKAIEADVITVNHQKKTGKFMSVSVVTIFSFLSSSAARPGSSFRLVLVLALRRRLMCAHVQRTRAHLAPCPARSHSPFSGVKLAIGGCKSCMTKMVNFSAQRFVAGKMTMTTNHIYHLRNG